MADTAKHDMSISIGEIAAFAGKLGIVSAGTKEKINTTLLKAAILVQTEAKQQAPVRTGKLRSSIAIQPSFKAVESKVIIAPHTNYAGIIHDGRGEVTATNKRVLASKINPGWGNKNAGGYYIIGKRSKAVPANPFMSRAYKLTQPEILVMFAAMRAEFMKGMGN